MNGLKRASTIFVFLLGTVLSFGQVSHGGEPLAWGSTHKSYGSLPFVELQLPTELSPTKDQNNASTGFKYGEQLFTNVDILNTGIWEQNKYERICRFEIRSPKAQMISLQFSTFHLAEGAQVFVFNASRTHYIGSFTKANNKPTGQLATAVVPGDVLVVEYREPLQTTYESQLSLGSITHGYVDIFHFNEAKDYDPGYQSSPCHNNVVCPSASAWHNEIRAVAMFLRPDGEGCTGTLINNTANDGTPYFYFANHCYQATEANWVFYFNYESPACSGNSGPTGQTVSGATFRSNYYYDDFALIELLAAPPSNYNVYYAGWDRSGANPTSQTMIHHPLYDVKKITFDNDPANSYSVPPYVGSPQDTYCWGTNWDDGIVEPVSSGAALFDQNHRIIGHLFDGVNSCGGAVQAGSGKFSYSWDGPSADKRLRDWLDPSNTILTLDGFDPNTASVSVRLRAFLEGPFNGNTSIMDDALRSQGLIPLTEPYSSNGYAFMGGGGETINGSILNITGNNAIVDWVVLELRHKNDPSIIVASRAALIQRDGDIVDLDGSSPVEFGITADDRFIALRHRNHLGVMLMHTVFVDNAPNLIDITDGNIPMYGVEALTEKLGVYALWSGDATFNGELKYTGSSNDRDDILSAIGGVVPTATVDGYFKEDANLDGVIKYTGSNNDRDVILLNIGGIFPTSTRQEQLP